jgi:hypothetical protein
VFTPLPSCERRGEVERKHEYEEDEIMAGGRRPVPDMPETTMSEIGEPEASIPTFASQEEADAAIDPTTGKAPTQYAIVDPALKLPALAVQLLSEKDAEIARLRAEMARMRPAALSPAERELALAKVPPARKYRNKERQERTFIDGSGRICRMLPNKILDERLFPIEFIMQQGFDLEEVDPSTRQIGRFAFMR